MGGANPAPKSRRPISYRVSPIWGALGSGLPVSRPGWGILNGTMGLFAVLPHIWGYSPGDRLPGRTILCEVGTDFSRFRNASAFASWLGLCPEKNVSGGKVLFTKSRRVRSRVATALRMGAQSLHHAKDYLGEFFRRIVRKLGKPQAITATAHKLARIIFHVLTTKEPYNESVFKKSDEQTLQRAEMRLRRQAAQLGYHIVAAENS
jgi:hypothetical protein